jgi:hypothetical protein
MMHTTNFRNPESFPPYSGCPSESYDLDIDLRFYRLSREHGEKEPRRHWCFLGEVVEDLTLYLPRIFLGVRDKNSKYLRVGFHFDNGTTPDYSRVRVGNVIAILYAERHFFSDGSHGFRLEDPTYVKVCCHSSCLHRC